MIVLVVLSTLLDTVLRVAKNILVNGKSKIIASTVNACLYICNAFLVKYIATSNTIEGLFVIIPVSWIGCYIAMTIIENIKSIK